MPPFFRLDIQMLSSRLSLPTHMYRRVIRTRTHTHTLNEGVSVLPLIVIPRLRLDVFTIFTSNVPEVGTTASVVITNNIIEP